MIELGRIKLGAVIADLCEQAGCDKKLREKHYKQFLHRWNPHPSQNFVKWWQPYDRDPISGADIGGHPDARRQWARKNPDGYVRRIYGINAETAYNCACYKDEYERWILLGCPEKSEPFVSVAATLERQKQFWHELKATIAKIGKPMPKVTAGDVALEAAVARTMPDP